MQRTSASFLRRWLGGRRALLVVTTLVVAAMYAPALLGQRVLVPSDIAELFAPWHNDVGPGFEPHNVLTGDLIDIHSHYVAVADEIRDGNPSWWLDSSAGGQPALKSGYSPFVWTYLLTPEWYAPGLAAALRLVVALGAMYGFVRAIGASRSAGLVAGVGYGLSGFVVGWSGWPHSNVAVWAPALLWAIEVAVRRPSWRWGIPLGLVVGAMVVANFPVVMAYILVAAGLYGVVRVAVEHRWRPPLGLLASGGLGVVVAAGVSALYLAVFTEYLSWGDTTYRPSSSDSSLGAQYMISLVFPQAFGSHHLSPQWWPNQLNWFETEGYVGLAVLMLAVLARRLPRVPKGVIPALWAIAFVGVFGAYVGGPVTQAVQALPGLATSPAGRLRVLIALGIAPLAGLGLDSWVAALRRDDWSWRRHGWLALGVGGALLIVAGPSIWRAVESMGDLGLLQEVASASAGPAMAGAALLVALAASWWFRSRNQTAEWLRVGAVLIVMFEMVIFAAPVHTTTSRSEYLPLTPVHQFLVDELKPGERMAGSNRAMFNDMNKIVNIDDLRGNTLMSSGWRALLTAVDERAFGGPGTVGTSANPDFPLDTDLRSPTLDVLAVRYWAQPLAAGVPGISSEPELGSTTLMVGAAEVDPIRFAIEVPEGGLRGVIIPTATVRGFGWLRFTLDGVGQTDRRLDEMVDGTNTVFPIAGEDLAPGSVLEAELGYIGRDGAVEVGATADGIRHGTVAGAEDGLRVAMVDDVTLIERLTAEPVRLIGNDGRAVAGSATIVASEDDTITVELSGLTSDATVAVSEVMYPGWTAIVDGEAVDAVEVNGALLGAPVGPGSTEVTFRYQPGWARWAPWVTVATLVAAAAAWFVSRRVRPS